MIPEPSLASTTLEPFLENVEQDLRASERKKCQGAQKNIRGQDMDLVSLALVERVKNWRHGVSQMGRKKVMTCIWWSIFMRVNRVKFVV